MFDAVVNHVSQHSEWYQRFLAGDPDYQDWFITVNPSSNLEWVSQVTRPRALPLLTSAQTPSGETLVWTTFSTDQIDLNFAHPPVLLKIIEVLLDYVEKGAQIIRLDAIAYLWKTIGTSCIHLEETHRAIKLMRCALDSVAPGVILITETNVPHKENISYFGQPTDTPAGTDEAQLVYQFSLPPLIMHSILTGDAKALSKWAANLETPSPKATFFNFTASHDGVGLMPASGLLEEAEIQALVDSVLSHGGRASYKTNPDGSRSVYELNISYFDALSDPASDEPQAIQVARFIASQAIMLAMAGLPGIYVHSLVGSRSWAEGVAQTGRNRTINREKIQQSALEAELADPQSLRSQVLGAYKRLLRARGSDPAFHPYGDQHVQTLGDSIFSLTRTSPTRNSEVLCLHNVSAQTQNVSLTDPISLPYSGRWLDLISGQTYLAGTEALTLRLPAYGVLWLKAEPS
jgi:sucrose phosphorylase